MLCFLYSQLFDLCMLADCRICLCVQILSEKDALKLGMPNSSIQPNESALTKRCKDQRKRWDEELNWLWR